MYYRYGSTDSRDFKKCALCGDHTRELYKGEIMLGRPWRDSLQGYDYDNLKTVTVCRQCGTKVEALLGQLKRNRNVHKD